MSKISSPEQKNDTIVQKLINQPWRMQEDYKRLIVTLQTQNEKYRNELYQLGETVNKILDKTKIKKDNTPNLESQLGVIKKQLQNANKFIEIYKKQLKNIQKSENSTVQLQTIAQSEETIKLKQKELQQLKKQVKELTAKNKGLEYRVLQYSRKNKPKSVDTAAILMKEALSENRQLKMKLEELEEQEKKKTNWLRNNVESTQDLQKKIDKLPAIHRRSAERLGASLPKLETQKKIYTKWLQTHKNKGFQKLQKQIQDLQKINTMVNDKITTTTNEIKQIQTQINKLKERVQPGEIEKIRQAMKKEEKPQIVPKKTKEWGGNSGLRVRRARRDWVGKFDGVRFSDSRMVREEARLFKIVHNSAGYYNFHYYSSKDKTKIYSPPLPFDVKQVQKGKQSTFTVEYPDYLKEFKLRINLKLNKIVYMQVTSNLGIVAEFASDDYRLSSPNKQPKDVPKDKDPKKKTGKDRTSTEQSGPGEIVYSLDVKSTQAPICMFGSYCVKNDEKRGNTQTVWLEGLGVELIEDFVEEKL